MSLLSRLPLRAPPPPRVELCALLRKNLDAAAHHAATSPLNLRPQPTEGQRSAGNYKKGHVRFAGLDITIENPAGSLRRPEWPTMQAHYGYVKGTEGKDGDHVDCFVRPATPIDWRGNAYVINQLDASGVFDEHKVMLGYDDQPSAERAYLAHYPRNWRLGPVAVMSLSRLRAWLNGDTLEPVFKREWNEEDHPRDDLGRFGEGTGGYSNKDGQWYQNGKPVSPEIQQRMKDLAVPPGWSRVSLNPDTEAALLATGKDSAGRTVYIRSAEKDAESSAEKFARLQEFNKVQGGIRETALKDMQDTSLSQQQRDAAASIALISVTGFRPGSEKDTGAKVKAYGATTLLGSHVKITGSRMEFEFTGKKGVTITHETDHPALAKYLAERQAANGDGRLFPIRDAYARNYFNKSGGAGFKVKDYRTWNGTMVALKTIEGMKAPTTAEEYKHARAAVGDATSAFLGNTRAVALNSYIHPAVFSKWEGGLQ